MRQEFGLLRAVNTTIVVLREPKNRYSTRVLEDGENVVLTR